MYKCMYYTKLFVDLLVQFSILDLSEDGALDYMEFSAFAGDTESSRRIFHTMDTDGNNLLTYQEALEHVGYTGATNN